LLTGIYEYAEVGIVVLDHNGIILDFNPALSRILERPPSEILDFTLGHFMDKASEEQFKAFFVEFTMGTAGDYYFESRFLPTHPRLAWWSLQLSYIRRESEGGKFFSAIAQDITLKKIDEEKLKEARILADKGNQAKSQFLANMTHEIRTPIHTITGMLELISQTELTQEQKDYVKQVGSSADALMSLVNDVLDFSKIESGRMVLENSDFILDEVIAQALDLIVNRAFTKNVEIVLFEEPAALAFVNGDQHRIRQVLVNLLSNAVKFTSAGSISLNVKLGGYDAESLLFLIEVKDSGIGIDSVQKERLFHPFNQGDNSTTRKFGGTGLGLSISRRLARMMGGDIELESEHGKGSVFSFTFFVQGKFESIPTSNLTKDLYSGKKVLLLESSEAAQEAACVLLKGWGFQTVSMSNGKEGLRFLASSGDRWDLILISENLPDYDPWSLAEVFRSLDNLHAVPLMLCSSPAHSLEATQRKSSKLFQGYVTKPLRQNLLAAEVMRALSGEPAPPVSSRVLSKSGKDFPLKGKKILIAEDHEVNRTLFKIIIEKMGGLPLVAMNGIEAVELYKKMLPDMVFLDLQMPELNGFETAVQLRQLGAIIPIVAVSASALKSEVEKAKISGMDDFISKPFKRIDVENSFEKFFFLSHEAENEIQKPPFEENLTNRNFNPAEALDIFMGNTAVLHRVLKNFLIRSESDLVKLQSELNAGNTDGVFRIAHTMKGSAYNLTAMVLGENAAEIEKQAKEGRPENIPNLIPKLAESWLIFHALVSGYLSGHAGEN